MQKVLEIIIKLLSCRRGEIIDKNESYRVLVDVLDEAFHVELVRFFNVKLCSIEMEPCAGCFMLD